MGTRTFFSNSDSDFYSENNNVSQVYTYIPKIKKNMLKKNANIIVYAQTVLHFAASLRNPMCYDLSFVFPGNLIWLLHCNAMHFASLLFLK
jgi:hypothetical protein